MKNKKGPWRTIAWVIVILFIISFILSGIASLFIGNTEDKSGNVAVISINGVIMPDSSNSFISDGAVSATEIVSLIEKADKNPQIKAILFEINSPGGTPVASEEIANAVLLTNKTTVAWIREIGASGAYWISSAADYIIASRMSVTGSIGVYGSYLEFAGLLQNWSIKHQRLVSGEYKDIGDPTKELTASERFKLQQIMDKLHEYFSESVASNRGLTNSEISKVSNGLIFLGAEAKELKLIDELGSKNEAIAYIEKKINADAELVSYKPKVDIFDKLFGLMSPQSFFVGKGIGNALVESEPYPAELVLK